MRRGVLLTSAAAALWPAMAAAQAAAPAEPQVDELIVTGTRIARDGYEAPTPLTVLGAERIAGSANSNLAQFVTTLPVFVGSANSRSTLAAGGAGTQGINAVSLRGLGANRTLLLVDGHRTTPAHPNGDVDANLIPQQLVSRIDVVTGGASAVYGSDAVAGVVNFVLDKGFTGLKGEVSGGATQYGDGENVKLALSGGFGFAGGRGHVLLSGESAQDLGIQGGSDRDWTKDHAQNFVNPAYTATNGQPQFLILNNTGYANAAPGGIVVSGPLRGTAFGQGGAPFALTYGDIVGDVYMRGGDYRFTSPRELPDIAPKEFRNTLFGRTSFDVTEHLNVYAQASWNRTRTSAAGIPIFMLNNNGPLISVQNPFIPEATRAQMIGRGLTSIRVGTLNFDSGLTMGITKREGTTLELGATGDFDLFGANWRWDAYAQRGVSDVRLRTLRNISRVRFALATDAVRDAAGQIVCRPLGPTATAAQIAAFPGCTPWNPMGIGVNAENGPAYDYIGNTGAQDLELEQDVYAASVTGEPFSNWAGPVSLALSAEHRRNSAFATVDAGSAAADNFIGNYAAINGETDVSEAAIEAVVPILADSPLGDSLDVNGAVRFTDYSRAGFVTTWKLGATYQVTPAIKFRLTRSRDIRAPNLLETFSPPATIRATVFDPFTNTSLAFNQVTRGNLDLEPEIATNTSFGVVLRPAFIEGASFSADWWDIKIKDAIATVGAAQTLLLCFDGSAPELCDNITRTNGVLQSVVSQSTNFALRHSRGIDLEASYDTPLDRLFAGAPGSVSLHGNATIYLKQYVDSRVAPPVDSVGELGGGNPPDWRATATLAYRLNALSTSLTVRGFPGGAINIDAIACTSGCPTSTTLHPTWSRNHLPGRAYLDYALSYELGAWGRPVTAFLNIRNLLDADPGAPRVSGNALFSGANNLLYDVEGRTYRLGLRFRM